MNRVCLLVAWMLSAPLVAAPEASDPYLSVEEFALRHEGRSARLWLTFFSAERFELRVIDNASLDAAPRYRNLESALLALGAAAGTNGGFFNREPFDAVGLMRCDHRSLSAFDPKSWMKGLLVVRASGFALESVVGFDPEAADLVDALQTGPWLVRDGRPETNNSRTGLAPRAFVGTDGRGQWFLGASTDCSLHDLSHFLCADSVLAHLEVHAALNLDGGPSAALWVRRGARDFYRQEKWPVRNYLAVLPRHRPGSEPPKTPSP